MMMMRFDFERKNDDANYSDDDADPYWQWFASSVGVGYHSFGDDVRKQRPLTSWISCIRKEESSCPNWSACMFCGAILLCNMAFPSLHQCALK